MTFTPDPNDRRRIDREAMIQRDEDVYQRRQGGESFRQIAKRLGVAASSVQRCYERAAKRHAELAALNAELDAALARYDDGMTADDVRTAADVGRLNPLEFYRLRHYLADSPQRRALADAIAAGWRPPPPEPVTYPINDGHHWRDGVDAALADDSGTDADDGW